MEHSSQNAFREEGGTSSRGYLFARSESMISNSSAIVIEAEQIRQRYNRLLPEDTRDDEKDYKTVVHTLSLDRLCTTLKTKVSEEGLCKLGAAGLKEEQARAYLETHGKNQLTPPPKRNRWLALLKLTFLGIFNVLLWFCVIAQVALIVIFSEEDDKGKAVAKLANMTTSGSFEEDVEEMEGDDEADYVTPIILAAVIIMAALLRWVAEEKAENQMEALQQIQDPEDVQVVRRTHDNNRLDVPLNPVYLVPGDVIFIEAGVRIPADVRILSCTEGMEVDNAAITGESKPVPRQAITEPPTMNVMDARNLAFFGTTVLKGTATCLVYATGDNTFIGKIAKSIKDADQNKAKSTLEVQIEHFIHIIGLVAIGVGALSFASNYFSPVHRTGVEILQNSSAALFAQVPEGLLPTVTISLMIAAEQMHRREVLVRKIDAIETLGCVSVLCSDKTGTLTKGEMEVQELVIPLETGIHNGTEIVRRNNSFPTSDKENKLENIAACGALNNGAKITLKDGQEVVEGSPTEKAIFEGCAQVLGGNNAVRGLKARPENRLIFNIPFNSENKWMLTVHGGGGSSATMILKGAPDRVLALCSVKEDPDAMRGIERTMKELMSQARRVLCIAKKILTPEELPANGKFEGTSSRDCNFCLEAFEFVGLYGIEDPPKQNVDAAVMRAQSAGVKVVMITGDHAETARAIASRINILNWGHSDHHSETETFHDENFTVITGEMIESRMPSDGQDNFTNAEPYEVVEWWRKVVVCTRVFARVSPIHKQVIVQAYQKWGFGGIGDICAMTGDGVNDAPALKQAEVGVAMGIRGTAVAKDAADVVLVNDDFSNIVDGIEQGRLTSENLQKSIMYTLCSKVPQVAPTFAELFGVPQALTVAQVLLIDIGTDIWTAIAYALQAAESRLMELRPRHPVQVKLVNWKVLVYSYGYMGQLQMLFCWLMFFGAIPEVWDLYQTGKNPNQYTKAEAFTSIQGMTVYYWTLVLCQIAAAISTTTKVQSVFGLGGPKYGFPNKTLSAMFLAEMLLGVFVIYVPWMQTCFETRWLPPSGLLKPIWALVGICFVEEVRKLIFRRVEQVRHQPSDNALEPGEEGRTAKKRYHDPFAALKIGSCTCYCMLTDRNSDY